MSFEIPEGADPFTFVNLSYCDPVCDLVCDDEPSDLAPRLLQIDLQGKSVIVVDRDEQFSTIVVFQPNRQTTAKVHDYEGWSVGLNLVDLGGTFSNDRMYMIHRHVWDDRTKTLRIRVECVL